MNPYTKKRLMGILDIVWGLLILIAFGIAGDSLWERWFGFTFFFMFIYIAFFDFAVQRIYCIPYGITSLMRTPREFLAGKIRIITFDEMLSYHLFTKGGIKSKRAVEIRVNRSAVGSIPVRQVITEDHVDDFDAIIKHLETGRVPAGQVKKLDKRNAIRGPWKYVEPDPVFLKRGIGYELPVGRPVYEVEYPGRSARLAITSVMVILWLFMGVPALIYGIIAFNIGVLVIGLTLNLAMFPITRMTAMNLRNNNFQIYVNGVMGIGYGRLYSAFIPFSKIKIEGIRSFGQDKIPLMTINEVDDRYSIHFGGQGDKVDRVYRSVLNAYSAWKKSFHIEIPEDMNLQPSEEKKYYDSSEKVEKPKLTVTFYMMVLGMIPILLVALLMIGLTSIPMTLGFIMIALIFFVFAQKEYRAYKKQEFTPLTKKDGAILALLIMLTFIFLQIGSRGG